MPTTVLGPTYNPTSTGDESLTPDSAFAYGVRHTNAFLTPPTCAQQESCVLLPLFFCSPATQAAEWPGR